MARRASDHRRVARVDKTPVASGALADDIRGRSPARTARMLLRSKTRRQDRRDRGVVGRRAASRFVPRSDRNGSLDTASPLDAATGVPNDWSAPFSAAWPPPKSSATRWGAKQNGDGSSTPRRECSWGMVYPGTGRSGRCTSGLHTGPRFHSRAELFIRSGQGVHQAPEDAWGQYLAWMRGCWRRRVAQVLEELPHRQTRLGQPPEEASDNDPRLIVATTITYLENNRERMDYPEYRRQGLPVTTAWMESLVKEVNYRAKGTEMFWNDPEGAEAILQVRAGCLV